MFMGFAYLKLESLTLEILIETLESLNSHFFLRVHAIANSCCFPV